MAGSVCGTEVGARSAGAVSRRGRGDYSKLIGPGDWIKDAALLVPTASLLIGVVPLV